MSYTFDKLAKALEVIGCTREGYRLFWKGKQLQPTWSDEVIADLKAYHNIDASREVGLAITQGVVLEILSSVLHNSELGPLITNRDFATFYSPYMMIMMDLSNLLGEELLKIAENAEKPAP